MEGILSGFCVNTKQPRTNCYCHMCIEDRRKVYRMILDSTGSCYGAFGYFNAGFPGAVSSLPSFQVQTQSQPQVAPHSVAPMDGIEAPQYSAGDLSKFQSDQSQNTARSINNSFTANLSPRRSGSKVQDKIEYFHSSYILSI